MPVDSVTDSSTNSARESLEVARMVLENRKLQAELERIPSRRWESIQRLAPVLGGLLTAAAFLFGVFQYVQQQDRALAAREDEMRREAAARDQEFMRPLWEREIATYFRTSEVVAIIATTRDQRARSSAESEFWKLYLGPLVILETKALSGAMVGFGDCLAGTEQCSDIEIKNRALAVSSAIQQAVEEHAAGRVSEFSRGKFQYHR